MSASSIRKGKDGEREAARMLGEALGLDLKRDLAQARDGGTDLVGIPGWAIEVKRATLARVKGWWQQTLDRAANHGERPALVYRINRQPWRVVVALRDLAPGFEDAPLELRLETDLETFARLVQRGNRSGASAPDPARVGIAQG